MLGALTSLTGGGGFTGAAGKSQSGDADGESSLTTNASRQYNAAFNVGGSGTANATQTAEQKPTLNNGDAQTLTYVALGVATLAVIIVVLRR